VSDTAPEALGVPAPEALGVPAPEALGVPAPEALDAPVFDAHCHLDAMALRSGRTPDPGFVAEVMAAARAVGVTRVITVGDTVASSRWCVAAANEHPDVYAAVAVHPTEIAGLDAAGYAELAALAVDERVVAVGETGLDYYWDRTDPREQQQHFRQHIALAKTVGKPVMIHDREAHADVLRILAEEGPPAAGTIFHSFSGDAEMAAECLGAGYVLSVSGVVTFRNAPGLRAAIAAAPLDQLLVETDAPFLTPHPHRGRPNSPRLVPWTVRTVAQVTSQSETAVSRGVWAAAGRLFGWS
jgi:TatD DNase family protein